MQFCLGKYARKAAQSSIVQINISQNKFAFAAMFLFDQFSLEFWDDHCGKYDKTAGKGRHECAGALLCCLRKSGHTLQTHSMRIIGFYYQPRKFFFQTFSRRRPMVFLRLLHQHQNCKFIGTGNNS